MTAADFRRMALALPGAVESVHMNHPDFRVGGKIFASLGYPDADHGMVVLPPDEQKRLLKAHPKVFTPAKGAWGKRGSTSVRLGLMDEKTLKDALEIAYRNRREKK